MTGAYSPVLWQGLFAKILRSQLNLNDNVYILTGPDNPTLVATDAPTGSIYLNTTVSGLYLKHDNGLTTNWSAIGPAIVPEYTDQFVIGDWVGPAIGFYTITFHHALASTLVEVEVWDASNTPVGCERFLTSANDVVLRVPASPDLRFSGLIWVKKS